MKQIIEQKVKEFSELINSALTKQQFLDAFKDVLNYLKKIEASLNLKIDTKISELDKLDKLYKESVRKIEADNDSSFSNFKKWVLEGVGKFFINSKINEKIREMDDRIAEINAYEPPNASEIALEASKMATEGLLPLIPIIDKVEEKLPQMGDIIADALEALPENSKLKIDAIKGLRELLEEVRKIKGRIGGGGTSDLGVAMSMSRIVKTETPSGLINGTNKVYTVSGNINAILSFGINGMVIHDNEYSFVNKTITFTTAIPADLSGTNYRITYI